MKICLFAPEQHEPLIEGIQKSAHETCRALREAGNTLLIFSQNSYGPDQKFIGEAGVFTRDVRYVFSTNKIRFLKYLHWFLSAKNIVNQITDFQPEKLIIFSLDWSFLPALQSVLRKLQNLPVTVCIFSMRELSGPGKRFVIRNSHRKNLRFRCFSKYLANRLIDLGVPAEQNQVEPVFFTKQKDVLPKIRADRYRIAYLSSSDVESGVHTAISLAREIPEADFTLAIRKFGTRQERHIQKFLSEMNPLLPANIRIMRNIPEMRSFLAATNTVILPPSSEMHTMALPLVALEAAAAGCQVLFSDLPIFSELEKSGLGKLCSGVNDFAAAIRADMASVAEWTNMQVQNMIGPEEFAKQVSLQ